ncbi:MAG: PIG-L family deacetylase [Candidatus Bathyarchaeota archaeon]|nr:PIG-L family deacetylase [Candidatus Bathyarchaeota archaeon]
MLNKNLNRKALVLVAHCDDAVLWIGGTIHHIRDWEWHVFSMCNGNDDLRIQPFNKSCEMLGVTKFQAFNFEDYQTGEVFSKNNKEKMKLKLTKVMDKAYDYVFSHSLQEWNEYSHHANHKEVGIISSEITKQKHWQLIQFCYYPIYGSDTATVAFKKRAKYFYQLNYEDLKFKLKLIDCFLNEMGNLKNMSYPCPNPEAFEGNNLPVPPFIRAEI